MTEQLGESHGPLEDERLRFYLKHRRQIEEWAALAKEVRAATTEVLESFISEQIEDASAWEEGLLAGEFGVGTPWPRLALARKTWPPSGVEPQVAVTFEWSASQVNPATATAPYIGVRISNAEVGKALRAAITQYAKPLTGRGYRAGSSLNWATFRVLIADPSRDWWLDLAAWKEELALGVSDAWRELSPLIERGLLDITPSPQAPPA